MLRASDVRKWPRGRPASVGGEQIGAGPAPSLLGREAILGRLEELLLEGRWAVLVGEPGIGKTALLRTATADRRAFTGGALGLLGFMPYLALGRAVGPLPDADPGAVAREVVRRLGPDGLLVLDDLHWADEATLDVLGRLVGSVPLLAALRSTDRAGKRVARRLSTLGAEIIQVAPLSDELAERLARERSPSLDPEAVGRVVKRAGGNPLLIEELARSGVTTSLRLAIEHRLRGLTGGGRDLLELLAVAGEPIHVPAQDPALRRLIASALVETVGLESAVRHALIAEVVVDGLAPDRLALLHRRAAGRSREPLTAARHLVAAGDIAEARALASAALADAPPGRYAVLAGIAAECAVGPDAPAMRVEAAERLVAAGWFREAERILDLAEPTTSIGQATALAVRAHTRWGLGDADGAVAAAERGLAQLEVASDASGAEELEDVRARLLVDLAWSVTLQRDATRGVPLATEALAAVKATGLPTGPAHRVLALALSIAGAPFDETMPILLVALESARAAGDLSEELLCGKLVVAGHEGGGDAAEGRRLGEGFVARARAAGMLAWEQSIRATLVSMANGQGSYEEAIAAGMALLAEPLEPRTRAQAAGYTCLALVDVGRLDEAAALIDSALATAPDDVDGRLDLLWARAELAFANGDPREADRLAGEILERFGHADYCDLRHVRGTQAWARFDLGVSPGPPLPSEGPMHAHVQGTVPESEGIGLLWTARSGEGSEADVRLLEAAARFAAAATLHGPFHRRSELRSRWARGEALRLAGSVDEAAAVLREAEQSAVSLGMGPLVRRIERSLRQSGERRSAPRSGQGGLTTRERQVLGLVGTGMTNAQIAMRLGIGRPTVARLVANAAAKLGSTSRMQTAARAAELG